MGFSSLECGYFIFSENILDAVVTPFVFPFGGNRHPPWRRREEQHGRYEDHTILNRSCESVQNCREKIEADARSI